MAAVHHCSPFNSKGKATTALENFVTSLPHNVNKSKNNITNCYINQITASNKFASYAKKQEVKSYA